MTAGNAIYVVAISHLDTQWRWTIRDTIRKHLPKTLRQNFEAFERFPGYRLAFDGTFRYRLVEEYFPEEFERLVGWVRRGRWTVAGGWIDAADVQIPSPEALIRQSLYGLRYLRQRLGVRPRDVFLPDCFGFGWALPSIAAHCGFDGFSSQKLSKGRAAEPIPFALGRWAGVDGAEIVAALEPGGYGEPLTLPPPTPGPALRYFGTGDTGGVPDTLSLRRLEAALVDTTRTVRTGPSDRLFTDLDTAEIANLRRHEGELLLNLHASGCYTSQAAMKRWNRRNQNLGRAAEAASAAADWLGALPYPTADLRQAWERFLAHQFHDDLTGTSNPPVYGYSWNDELLSLNQFARMLTAAVGAISCGLDTKSIRGHEAHSLVVWNSLEFERRDAVEATLPGAVPAGARLRVVDPEGCDVPAQVVGGDAARTAIVFVATAPATGCAVFQAFWDRESTGAPIEPGSFLAVDVDGDGRLAGIGSAPGTGRLRNPVELQLLADSSWRFPSWEIRYEDVREAPRERVGGPAVVRVLEPGPARLAIEVRRRGGGSTFVDRVFLADGSDLVEIQSTIDWQSRRRLLKLAISADLEAPTATYDLGLGAIQRGVNSPRLWEVPAQSWADLSASSGGRGLAVFSDCKHGWDRPDATTLRLSLLHTPRVGRRFRHQGRQDLGVHRHRWALWPHARATTGAIARRAARFEQPLVAFHAVCHDGPLGRRFSFAEVGGEGEALLMALKKCEDTERYLLRLRETAGAAANCRVRLGRGAASVAEVNGAEEYGGRPVSQQVGDVVLGLRRFQPRSLAVELAPPLQPLAGPAGVPVVLPPGAEVTASRNTDRRAADFDGRGRSYPAELLPEQLAVDGVRFNLSGRRALACRGQVLAGAFGGARLELLASSSRGPVEATFRWLGETERGAEVTLRVPDWTGFVGAWQQPFERTPVAWVGTHRHARRGDDAYRFCYLWRLVLAAPPGAKGLQLPDDRRVRLFAATLVTGMQPGVEASTVLYD